MCSTLALPCGFRPKTELEGLLLHPVSFRKFREDVAKTYFIPPKGLVRVARPLSPNCGGLALAEAKATRAKCRLKEEI
jgi:hypothetical protein